MSDTTTSKGKFRVGLAKWLGGLALIVLGSVNTYGYYNTNERISQVVNGVQTTVQVQTGSVQKLNNQTVNAIDWIPLSLTGSKANYDLTFVDPADYGIVGSGVTLNIGLHMVRNPTNAEFDIAYMKTARTASGSSAAVLASTVNMTVASGSTVLRGSASGSNVFNGSYSRWNGADKIVVKTTSTFGGGMSGYLLIQAIEDPSE